MSDSPQKFGALNEMKIRRLNHLQICVSVGAESQARQFYADVLGLTEIEKPDALKPNGGLWFQIADIQLHIGVEDAPNKSKRHPAFEIENLAAARRHLETNGVAIQEETPIPRVNRFSFFDPFGNRIEFLEFVPEPEIHPAITS